MIFSHAILYCIILSAGATLHTAGINNIETAADAAKALEPSAGGLAKALFVIGLIGIVGLLWSRVGGGHQAALQTCSAAVVVLGAFAELAAVWNWSRKRQSGQVLSAAASSDVIRPRLRTWRASTFIESLFASAHERGPHLAGGFTCRSFWAPY